MLHYLMFQKVIHVRNYYSLERTVFNLLRSKRPSSKASEDVREYVDKLDAQTRRTCDFCQYKTNTAEDTFGRFVSMFMQYLQSYKINFLENIEWSDKCYNTLCKNVRYKLIFYAHLHPRVG
jgi:hypothetical protein